MRGLNRECRLQEAVDYLVEYSGVMGVVISDGEGLAIACSPRGLKSGELYAALGLEIFRTADNCIGKLIDPGSHRHTDIYSTLYYFEARR